MQVLFSITSFSSLSSSTAKALLYEFGGLFFKQLV